MGIDAKIDLIALENETHGIHIDRSFYQKISA